MSARAVPGSERLAWAAGLLLLLIQAQAGESAQPAPVSAQSTTRSAEITLDYIARAPELSVLRFVAPPTLDPGFKTSLSYYHPILQNLNYSPEFSGPTGRLDLPDERRLRMGLVFSLTIAGERRVLQPGARGVKLTTTVGSGHIREHWIWPDGVILNRMYFQTADVRGSGIRHVIHNQGRAHLKGVRLEARLRDPEIAGTRVQRSGAEADDEIAVDPRHATLYLRDFLRREESWLGMGWSGEGGYVTAGESLGRENSEWDQPDYKNAGLTVGMETAAQDLMPGQYIEMVFWQTWGPDRETVFNQLNRLFAKSGYHQWEEEVKAKASQGVQFTCEDPYLVHLFQSIKSWAPWMARRNSNNKLKIVHPSNTSQITPIGIIGNLPGFLVLKQKDAVHGFLDHWFDQRVETPEAAGTIILACQYFVLTQDQTWRQKNAERILELTRFLADLDQDQDGLPDYHLPAEVYPGLYPPLSEQHPAYGRAMSFSEHALISVWAFRLSSAFVKQIDQPEFQKAGQRFLQLANRGAKSLEKKYWQDGLGHFGFLAYSRLTDTGYAIPYQGSSAIRYLQTGIGDPVKQKKVFQALWDNPAWRTGQERYRSLLGEDQSFPEIRFPRKPQVDCYWTHQVLSAGLINQETSEEAVRRLLIYAQAAVLDPEMLGLPGRQHQSLAGAGPAALSFIPLVYTGLAGLVPDAKGMRVVIPSYPQDLGVQLKRLPYQNALLDVTITGPGGGGGTIRVNGKRLPPGGYVPAKVLKTGRVRIAINRKKAEKKGVSQRKSRKTLPRKSK